MSIHDWLYNISREVWPFAANHVWQTTLVCGLAMAGMLLLNRKWARARYAVWLIISLKFALPSAVLVALFGLNRWGLESFIPQTEGVQNPGPPVTGFFDIVNLPTDVPPGQTHSEIYCVLSFVWLAGFVLVLARWLCKRVEFSHLLRASRVVSIDRESAALNRVKGWLRVRSDIELIVAPEITEPGVWRIFHPAIVLPENISSQLSDPELESLMMHEVIHIQRKDNLIASLQMILCSIFWFHPLIWIIDRKMIADREQACDQAVCLFGGQSAVYATSLLKVLRFCIGSRMPGVSGVVGSNLKRRIEEIMHNEVEKRSSSLQRAFVVTVALAVVLFSVAIGVMSRDRLFLGQDNKRLERVEGGEQGGVRAELLRGAVGAPVGSSGTQDSFTVEFRNTSESLKQDLKNAPTVSLSFDNNEQPPVIITEARMKAVRHSSLYKRRGDQVTYWAEQYAVNASVTLLNNSPRLVKRVWLVFSCDEAGPVGYSTDNLRMEPGATVTYVQTEWSGLGDPSSFSVRVVQVLFDDGARWPGSVPAGTDAVLLPPPPPPPLESDTPTVIRKGSVLQDEAINRVVPSYPDLARAARISGSVVIHIEINSEGNVAEARVVSGHPLLRDAALEAARQWTFAPSNVNGRPVPATCTLTFNFKP